MAIKIKETIERECCQKKDMLKYNGCVLEKMKISQDTLDLGFCKHCGELWIYKRKEHSDGYHFVKLFDLYSLIRDGLDK